MCREVRNVCPTTACLILTSFSDDEALLDAIMGGAAGYVLKDVTGMHLIDDIRKVARGESLIDPDMSRRLVERSIPHDGSDITANLTDQERLILALIAEGLTNRQIAERIYLAEKTVKNYVSRVMAKLGVSHRTQAAVLALRQETPRPHRT